MKTAPKPPRSCFDKSFVYTPAVQTDVAKTFERLGFIPPSVARQTKQSNPKGAKES